MRQIITLSNSFVLQEIDGNGNVISELGFKKGGLSYKIQNNNVKFYLVEDYFYKNVVWSADAPLIVDGVPYSINEIPTALKKIFIQEVGSGGTIDIDHELNPRSDNAVANSTLTPIIRGIQNDLLTSYYTKMETLNLFKNYSKVENDVLLLNSENL